MNKMTKIFICLSFGFMIVIATNNDAFSAGPSSQPLAGAIWINIDGSECHEYVFHPSNQTMQDIPRDKIVLEENNGRKVCRSSTYKNVWNEIRGKQFLDKKQFEIVFGRFDLSKLSPLSFELFRNRYNDCNTKITYKLRENSLIEHQKENYTKYSQTSPHFSINDQKTFSVYKYRKPALLIDLSSMTITNAFCNKPVFKPVWDKKGLYLAYTTTTPTSEEYDELIAVTDIKNASVIMEKRINKHVEEIVDVWDEALGRKKLKQWNPSTREFEKAINTESRSDRIWVSDIAWNPSSDHIAVLTHKSRMGYWPWQLLASAAGHGIFYETFFLSVYDMKGRELFTQRIVSDVRHGRGSLVWTDE